MPTSIKIRLTNVVEVKIVGDNFAIMTDGKPIMEVEVVNLEPHVVNIEPTN